MVKKIAIISVLIGAVGLIFLGPKLMLFIDSRKTSINTESKEIFIKEETDINQLATLLKSEGIIDDNDAFIKVGNYKSMTKENIALGKYLIEPKTAYKTLLNGFKINAAGNGNAEVEVAVTFNNCRFLSDLSSKVSQVLLIDSVKMLNYLNESSTYDKYGFTKEQFPSMFLPNTYKMYYDTKIEDFVMRMAKEFKKFWTEERLVKLKKVGLKSPSECSTLASIIYSEQSKVADEWPVIAGLYLNRLNQGIKLQSDPTFKFCWGKKLDGVQRLLFEHRDIDCGYNTYKINGLPPGPICMPPTEVLDAVLNRDNNKYIFMMAKPDFSGRHDFTIEYADHERLARIYQKWLSTLN